MKQLLRYTLTLVALFVATANLSAQTYNGGTWYSLYDGETKSNTTAGTTFCEKAVFAPAESMTFEYIKYSWASINGNLEVQNKVNGSWSGSKGSVSYSDYKNWKTSGTINLDPNISHIRYKMSGTGAKVRNHFVKLKKHILLYDDTDSKGMDYGTSSIGTASTPRPMANLATAEGKTSTSAYTIRFRSFLASGDITIKSSNPEFHFGNGQTSITLGVANNYCASANGSGNCSATTLGQISNYSKQVYFSPSVQHNKDTRSTTITISDGTSTAYIYLSAPVIPTYFFKAEAISSPAEGGTATATFANGQDNCSVIATNYTTTSMSATVTFTAAPKTADGYVFEGWKKDPANATFHIQGAGKTTITETITSSALNPNGLASQLTLYAIYSRRYTAKITGSNYTNKLVNESWPADYQFVNTQTATPSNSDADSFYFKIDHDFTGNDTHEDSPRPDEVIAYDPVTNTITALNEGTATITFYQKNTSSHEPVTESFTVQVIKHTPKFTWNAARTPYYYGISIPNIFSTTNTDIETTFVSDNEAFARVENNTLYIANARETATITVSQPENYKWYSNSEQYVIAPVNGDNHVQFTITSENYYNVFRYDNTGNLSWKNDGVLLGSPDVGSGAFDYNDRYYDIVFTGVPDTLSFTYERSTTTATNCDWYVKESADGVTWSEKNVWEIGNSSSGSVEVQLNPTTHYLRFCYSGNYGGYFRNIHVSERFQFEATPTSIDFGSKGITYGMQHDTITFLHANAGRITRAVITGADAKYFNVTPELVPGTGRDCFGNAALEVTFDNLGEDRGATPYKATLTISDNSDKTEDIHIPLTGIRDGKSTADIIWNPNALPYYFNSTIANIAYSTNRDANCPLTFATTDNTIAEVKNGDLHIYNKGQEVTITVTQPGNADFMPATKSFTFTPCERPSLEAPFFVSQALHANSVQLGTKSGWYQTDNQIRIASTSAGDGFIWGDDRKRVLITFAGTPDKLYFEYSSSDAATPQDLKYGWEVEESPDGVDWNSVWTKGSLSASWASSGEIDLRPNTQYIRFSYKGNYAGYIRNIIVSSLEGNNYLRAEEGGYLSRGAKWGTQAVVDPFGMVCRVSHFTVDNTNIYTRLQFVDNMQYLYETADTKEVFTDAATADNPAYLWKINSNASGKFTVQSANDLDNGNRGNYFTIIDNTLAFTSDPAQATVWYMETPAQHNDVVKSYMDAAAAKAAEKDFGSDINTLEKVRSSLNREDFEITEVAVPAVALAEQAGVYRDEINGTGTFAVYDTIISGLKPGFYRLTVKALYRISDSQKAQAAKTNGWESVLAYVYANDVKYPIQSVYASYNAGNYDASDEIYNGHSYPTKLNSVERAFNQDHNRYLNDVYVYVEADSGKTTGTLRYGIKNPSYVPGAWLAYSTITLTRFGRKEYIFNGRNNDNWHEPSNWSKNAVPNQYHNVRIEANVNISSPVEVFGLTIAPDCSIHIASTETSTGGLSVGAHGIQGAASDGSSIIIDNLKTGAGFLRISPDYQGAMPRATVNYQTRSTLDTGANQNATWQYFGAPGKNVSFTIDYITWLYQWNEKQNWVKQNGTLTFEPFAGYAITQYGQPTYSLKADPIRTDQTITLTKTPEDLGGMNGDNLFANSYMAPIDVKNFTADDFTGNVEKTFYIFNSGSWNQWNQQNEKDSTLGSNGSTTPGQYCAIPALSAQYLDSQYDITTIPPMQGVYVITNEDGASIHLNYNKHVWQAGTYTDASTNMNESMRAPQREAQDQMQRDDFLRVRLQVNSANSGADRMYIIQEHTTTRDYDNGYDAPNQFAEGIANIYTNEPFGKMEVSCANNIDSIYIGFQAGTDDLYTLSYRSLIGESLYLKDLSNDSIFLLTEGGQYHFTAQPHSTNDLRFQVLLNPTFNNEDSNAGVTTDMEYVADTHIWHDHNQLYITNAPANSTLALYNINGQLILSHTTQHTTHTIDLNYLHNGVYILQLNNQMYKFVRQ
ncbi:MAG: T9SS type A sorting domain-containing protein [Paludibacteraceae bacterium]|nr:T9SS type A sorting domain-containing protein [Paludibacteraceae bacterium]